MGRKLFRITEYHWNTRGEGYTGGAAGIGDGGDMRSGGGYILSILHNQQFRFSLRRYRCLLALEGRGFIYVSICGEYLVFYVDTCAAPAAEELGYSGGTHPGVRFLAIY